jgi:hypothetical protein
MVSCAGKAPWGDLRHSGSIPDSSTISYTQ